VYIVGTSGHIDHGKTSLIRALSGTDCDRLPEEKAREMTIDIGFASIDYPRFGTVSIVDVPGHERFIRNMVAGAWGIDIALLVVAVDDGWMPQTEDHFRVLELLGIERIIVVLNKVDLADEEMVEMVQEEIAERLEHTPYSGSEMVKVSSKTGAGIDELKEVIVANLRKLAKASDTDRPYLYIDRVFSPRGVGSVITGTLKNGTFVENETLTILPSRKDVKIKKIESHHRELHEGTPSQRTALNLSGINAEEVERGHILCRSVFFTESDDIIAVVKIVHKNKKLRNNSFIEILAGTYSVKGKLILLNESEDEEQSGYRIIRIRLEEKWFFYPGQAFVITNPGGYRILGGGKVLIADFDPNRHRKSLRNEVKSADDFSLEKIIEFNIAVKGIIKKGQILSFLPLSRKAIEKVIDEILSKGRIVAMEDYLVSSAFRERAFSGVRDAVIKNVGLNLKEISDIADTESDICRIIIKSLTDDGEVFEKEGRYFSGDSVTEDNLSDSKKKVLDQVMKNGSSGIELDKVADDRVKKDIKDLIKLGFLVSLDGNIIYHSTVYENLKKGVMELFLTHDKITVPEAKDAAGLSRKYILPLLNRIENEGLIKRLGDFRIKV
jgi:selenocysteine-specific elongation factor